MFQHECDHAAMPFDVVGVQVEAGDASAALDNGPGGAVLAFRDDHSKGAALRQIGYVK